MAYSIDENYKGVSTDINQYLQEQEKLKEDINKSTLGLNISNISSAATNFRFAADAQDKIDAFDQMTNDYFDGKKIDQIIESRRRDPLNQAIDERDNRIQNAMQQGSYVDSRDKNLLFHNNPQQFEQARIQGEVANQGVLADAEITSINQQKDIQLNQAELDVIKQLTGKNDFGQERHQTIEDLQVLREKMKIIQEMKTNTKVSSQIEKPHVMSTEELMANQLQLQQLHQQLGDEYQELNSSLSGKKR